MDHNLPTLELLELGETGLGRDSTVYPVGKDHQRVEAMVRDIRKRQPRADGYSIDCRINLKLAGHSPETARLIACRCFQATQWSLTIRRGQGAAVSVLNQTESRSNFEPNADPSGSYFTTFRDMCNRLYNEIFSLPRRTGLIAITGATASGKSEVARGLIWKKMSLACNESKRLEERRPHLITFEDPIEKFYVKDAEFKQPSSFDYTPREKDLDARSLAGVFRDALRQTPTLVFVGEIRDPKEWIEVVEFAGTGHSVIATAHAGSLAEAWGKILGAVKANDAQKRSDIADRVLGIVHLRTLPNSGYKGAFPAFWRYSIPGAKSLMADGRGALLPQRGQATQTQSSFGRVWFTETIRPHDPPHKVLKAAIESDLEGL